MVLFLKMLYTLRVLIIFSLIRYVISFLMEGSNEGHKEDMEERK